MRYLNKLIFLSFLTVLLMGCDDFLDIVPTGRVIPHTVKEFRGLMTQAYSNFPKDRGLATFRSDEVMLNETSSMDVENFRDIYIWKDDNPAITTFPFKWLDYYEVVFHCNHVIQEKDHMEEGTDEEMEQLVGEAYLLRAYTYFTMVNLYAPAYNKCDAKNTLAIPLNLDNDMNAVLSRVSVDSVYHQVESDLKEGLALMHMDAQPKETLYRFSKSAALAFKTRVALYKEDWDEVIASGLECEKIFPGDLVDMVAHHEALPNHFESSENIMALEQSLVGDYAKAMYVSEKLKSMYSRYDYRTRTFYEYVSMSISRVKKAGQTELRSSFRLSEIYLSLAEAYCHKNDLKSAREYLYKILTNRLRSSYLSREETRLNEITDNSVFLQEVVDERFRELAFEGHRWFDLRRTGQVEITHSLEGQNYILTKNDKRYSLPIPEEARLNNPNLLNQ